MMGRVRAGAVGLLALFLAGCQSLGSGGSIGGSLAGGLYAGPVGVGLSPAAARAARDAEYRALEFGRIGAPVDWKSGDAHGEVVPGSSYRVNAYDCRDYTHSIAIGSAPAQSARGTACRQANGVWQPVT
jgi:surface antigen